MQEDKNSSRCYTSDASSLYLVNENESYIQKNSSLQCTSGDSFSINENNSLNISQDNTVPELESDRKDNLNNSPIDDRSCDSCVIFKKVNFKNCVELKFVLKRFN